MKCKNNADFQELMRDIISRFPEGSQERARRFLGYFNQEGKETMLGIMVAAYDGGKLDEAFEILEKQFREHWMYRPNKVRGSMVTDKDPLYIEDAYHKLGIPLPDTRS